MTALAYLHANGLDAETLMGNQIAVWPEDSITPEMERWISEHKSQLVAELRGCGENPDELLLAIAQTLQSNPARLRAMLTDDDMQDIAEGLNSPADMLDFFRLAQENGDLLADDTPEPTRKPESRPGHVELMQAWKPAHDDLINHLMACSACHAPRARYCTDGAELRRAYLESYQNAQQPE